MIDRNFRPFRTEVTTSVCWTARNQAAVYNSPSDLKTMVRQVVKLMSVFLEASVMTGVENGT